MERAQGLKPTQRATDSYGGLRVRDGLPQERAHQVVIQYQVIRPPKIKREKFLHLKGW